MMTARRVRVVCGDFWGKKGPVEGVAADPRYLDIFVPPGKRKTFKVEVERHAFAYVFEGSGTFRPASKPFGVLSEKEVDGKKSCSARRPATVRCSVRSAATRSPCRQATKASVSCWCPANRSRSRSPGMDRS